MKKIILLLSFGLLILTGCNKEESDVLIEEQTVDAIYMIDQSSNTATWETTEISDLSGGSDFTYSSNGGNIHTDGYFSGFGGLQITWDGTAYDPGALGGAEIEWSNPNFGLHYILETECVSTNGNEAVYGGTITDVLLSKGNPPPFGVGWHFYFKVIDNGYGSNEPSDEIANIIIFSPPPASRCNLFVPTHPLWSLYGYSEMIRPSRANVN